MDRKSVVVLALVAAVAAVAVAAIMRTGPRNPAATESADPSGALEYPRGPHGARLLSDDGLQVEMTIYEAGVPPQFRVYPFDAARKPIPPREVNLDVELHRLGGRVDRITFTPEGDSLRGNQTVEEPHSFDVKVMATRGGKTHSWSYSQIEGKVRLAPDQVKSAGIVVGTAGPRPMQTSFELPGEVKADATRQAQVVPRVAGVVLDVRKQAGDRVRRGELMVVLSSRELAEAKGAYLEAIHRLDFARTALDREERLWRKKIAAEREYLEAKREAEEAALAQDVAAQKLVALGLPSSSLAQIPEQPRDALPRFEIRAPLDGTVLDRQVTAGEAVTSDKTLFIVADLSSVWVELSVYAKDLGAVRIGQEATAVSSDLGIEATGRISFIGQLVGEDTRSAPARLTLSNPKGDWRPGLFVTVKLVRDQATVPLAVAADAIQTFRDWQVVFVKYGDWFEARPLELGRSDGQFVEVLSGLRAGEEYAAANSFAIKAEIGKLGATHDH